MISHYTPKWLIWAERKFKSIGVPHMAVTITALQVLGFFVFLAKPHLMSQMALIPSLVLKGEVWRLVTFFMIPLTTNMIFVIFTWLILYFFINTMEQFWGEVKTTLYIAMSYIFMVSFSFAFDYPIFSIYHFETTLFLATAAIMPNYRINLFFVFPIEMRWLALFSLVTVLLEFFSTGTLGKLFLLAVYANALLFFGPYAWHMFARWKRRRRFKVH
jgi:hypothetical protein